MGREPGPYTDRPSVRERLVQIVAWVLRIDLLDAHLFNGVENGRYNSFRTQEMRNRLVKLVEEDPVDLGDPRTREMHSFMLGDEGVNGGGIRITGERQDDGTWEHEVHGQVSEDRKEFRKREMLVDLAERADLEDVVTDEARDRYSRGEEGDE